MRPTLTTKRASLAGAVLALAALPVTALPAAAGAASAWSVAHPPYTAVDNVPYAPLEGITAVSASNVWAVGQDSGTPQINHWNGSAWSQSSLPNGPCSLFEADCVLTGVSGDSASDVIAVGQGTIPTSAGWVTEQLAYRWNGSAWSQLTVPATFTYDELERIQTFSPTDAWAVGVGATSSGAGTVTAVNWNGSSWTAAATPVSTGNNLTVNAISGSSASDIWVAGQTVTPGYHNRQFTSVLLHYNGSSWSQLTAPDNSGLLDVDAVSPTDAWAIAADGSVLTWNGMTWSVATTLAQGNTAIAALSPTDVWVAGVVSLTHYNGSSWTSAAIPSGISALTGHAVLAPGRVWFSGYYYPSNAVTAPAMLGTSAG
jgi:hypothetical protein